MLLFCLAFCLAWFVSISWCESRSRVSSYLPHCSLLSSVVAVSQLNLLRFVLTYLSKYIKAFIVNILPSRGVPQLVHPHDLFSFFTRLFPKQACCPGRISSWRCSSFGAPSLRSASTVKSCYPPPLPHPCLHSLSLLGMWKPQNQEGWDSTAPLGAGTVKQYFWGASCAPACACCLFTPSLQVFIGTDDTALSRLFRLSSPPSLSDGPEPDPVLQVWTQQCWAEGRIRSPPAVWLPALT